MGLPRVSKSPAFWIMCMFVCVHSGIQCKYLCENFRVASLENLQGLSPFLVTFHDLHVLVSIFSRLPCCLHIFLVALGTHFLLTSSDLTCQSTEGSILPQLIWPRFLSTFPYLLSLWSLEIIFFDKIIETLGILYQLTWLYKDFRLVKTQ